MKLHETKDQKVSAKYTFIHKRNISLKPLDTDYEFEGAEKKKEGKNLRLKLKVNTKHAKSSSN